MQGGGRLKVRARLCPSLALGWRLLATRTRHEAPACRWFAFATKGVRAFRHIEQAGLRLVLGARRRPSRGACSSLPLALDRWRVLAAKHQAPARGLLLQRKPPMKLRLNQQASLRLVLGARRRLTQGACSSLPLAIDRCRVLAAKHLHAHVVCFCNGSRQ